MKKKICILISTLFNLMCISSLKTGEISLKQENIDCFKTILKANDYQSYNPKLIGNESLNEYQTGAYVNEKIKVTNYDNRQLHLITPDGTHYKSKHDYLISNDTNGWYTCYTTDYLESNKSDEITFYFDNVKPIGNVIQQTGNVINSETIYDSFYYEVDDETATSYVLKPNSSKYEVYEPGTMYTIRNASGIYYFYSVDKAGNVSDTVWLNLVTNLARISYKQESYANMFIVEGDENQEQEMYVKEDAVVTFSITKGNFDSDSPIKSGKVTFSKDNYPEDVYYILGTNKDSTKFKIKVNIIREKPYILIDNVKYYDGDNITYGETKTAYIKLSDKLNPNNKLYLYEVNKTRNNIKTTSSTKDDENAISDIFDGYEDDEVSYEISIIDNAYNKTVINLTIDMKATDATWYSNNKQISNNSKINTSAYLEFDDPNSHAYISKDNQTRQGYLSGTAISEPGYYVIEIIDQVNNISTYTININKDSPIGYIYQDDTLLSNKAKTNKSIYFTWDNDSYSCLLNGEDYEKETLISDDGDYVFKLYDDYGNYSIYEVTIDLISPSYNKQQLIENNKVLISRYYKLNIESETNIFPTYLDAYNYALLYEKEHFVTKMTLNNTEDFTDYDHLADSSESVKVGTYYKYKNESNPEEYSYYFDVSHLETVIEKYASNYVSGPYYMEDSDLDGNLSEAMYDTKYNGEEGILGNDFIFVKEDSYKVEAKNRLTNEIIDIQYNVKLKNQLKESGLYDIYEYDEAGNISLFCVYIDLDNAIINASATYVSDEASKNIQITKENLNNLSNQYFTSFKINSFVDDDNYALLSIEKDGDKTYYTKEDEIPSLETYGIYTITIFDRADNKYSFDIYIVSSVPEITFKEENSKLNISINIKESFNYLKSLKIYYNDTLLDNIQTYSLEYSFLKGGKYTIELVDKFSRVVSKEYYFNKDTPEGTLSTLSGTNITNKDVDFTYDNSKYYAKVYLNSSLVLEDKSGSIHYDAKKENEGEYKIVLIDLSDEDLINEYYFIIDVTGIEITMEGCNNNSTTNNDVSISFDSSQLKQGSYIKDGETSDLLDDITFTEDGNYQVILEDNAGNISSVSFTIDKSIDCNINVINDSIVSQDVIISAGENVDVSVIKDGKLSAYNKGDLLNLEGEYFVTFSDLYGNKKIYHFTLINQVKRIFSYKFDDGSKIISIQKDDIALSINDNQNLQLSDTGEYEITVQNKFDQIYEFNLSIYSTPPQLKLIGVDNGGQTTSEVSINGIKSEYTYHVYKDGVEISYKEGDKLTDVGYYEIVVMDKLGNQNKYSFTIKYKSEILYMILGIIAGILTLGIAIIFIHKRKINKSKK